MEQDADKQEQGVQELLRHRESTLGIPPSFDMSAQPWGNGGMSAPAPLPRIQPPVPPEFPTSWPNPATTPPVVDLTNDLDTNNLFATTMEQATHYVPPQAPQQLRPLPGAFGDLLSQGVLPQQGNPTQQRNAYNQDVMNFGAVPMQPQSNSQFQVRKKKQKKSEVGK